MPEKSEPPFSPGIAAIFEVVARLRAPGGCPWDREQTHESLRPYLLEETSAKMVARHPHVFGDVSVADADEVLRNWEHAKGHEARSSGRADESVVDRVPATLPALAWTLGLQKRAARVGFDFESPTQTAEQVAEEARELAEATDSKQAFEEMGDLLFAVVSLARRLKINPEDALRVAGQRFRRRFAQTEASLRRDGVDFRDLDRDAIAKRWEETR